MRKCLMIPFTRGKADIIFQKVLALSIMEQRNWNSRWKDNWEMEPVIWIESRLSELAASERMKDLERFYHPSEPVKLTVAGLVTSKHPEKDVLWREFPFLGRPGSGGVSASPKRKSRIRRVFTGLFLEQSKGV